MEELMAKIFNLAKEKGLKNVSIRITANQYCGFNYVLYVGEKDRFTGPQLDSLLHMLSGHKELSWMNS